MYFIGNWPNKRPAVNALNAKEYADHLGKCEVLATKVYEAVFIPERNAKEISLSIDVLKAKIDAAKTQIRAARQGVLCAFNIFAIGATNDDEKGCMNKEQTSKKAPSDAHQDATMLKSISEADRLTNEAFSDVKKALRNG